jgi:hypothetical protein
VIFILAIFKRKDLLHTGSGIDWHVTFFCFFNLIETIIAILKTNSQVQAACIL